MMLAVLGLVISAGVFVAWKGKSVLTGKILKVLIVFFLLGVLVAAGEKANPVLKEQRILTRKKQGEGAYEVELEWKTPEEKKRQKLLLRVDEKGYGKEEERQLLEAAKQEITETFPGKNASVNEIRTDVCMRENYQNGAVQAEWSLDNYSLVTAEGEVSSDEAPADGTLVKANVLLKCQSMREEYEFYFCIYPPVYTKEEQFVRKVDGLLQEQAAQMEREEIVLPESVDGKELSWEVKREYLPEKLCLLGLLVACCVPAVEKSKRQEEEKKRKHALMLEYPELVSKLTILMGAGMTVFSAWRRIVTNYEEKRKNGKMQMHPLYEEMKRTCREIDSGVSEIRALEHFGDRVGIHRYRKFCSLIIQNRKKGTKGLEVLLEHEVADAFEERKNLARKYGEEAGTKLLLPMMMMFGIVIAIIMVPAFMSFQ